MNYREFIAANGMPDNYYGYIEYRAYKRDPDNYKTPLERERERRIAREREEREWRIQEHEERLRKTRSKYKSEWWGCSEVVSVRTEVIYEAYTEYRENCEW